ncbi:MAG: pyridoxal 5'-phosphate synthase [Burkholderiales bacterium]|nr:pyridoxal 5'-phosphate synthase [Burkholderiales bacterium]
MKLAELRQEYMRAGLSEADAQEDPIRQFELWFNEALAAALPLANAMTLATVRRDARPNARVVLLKGVEDGGFVFYTNYESAKGRELAHQPEACLVFLWAELERQVRIDGRVEPVRPRARACRPGRRRRARASRIAPRSSARSRPRASASAMRRRARRTGADTG